MSFYFEEGQASQDASTQSPNRRLSVARQQSEQDTEGFRCDNCGGIESYLDEASGGLICVSCFTQSQTTVSASQEEVEYEEAMALAGRVSGRLTSIAASPRSKKRKRQRIEGLDNSAPLPNVQDCIIGVQRVLDECLKILSRLLCLSRYEIKCASDGCKSLWRGYVRSWMEGAEFFGKLYPEIRFSFRDLFLSVPMRTQVLKALMYRASMQIQSENREEETVTSIADEDRAGDEDKEKSSEEDCASGFTDETIDIYGQDDDNMASDVARIGRKDSNGARDGITQMLALHYKRIGKNSMGRKGAALALSPSLKMVAVILCLSLEPLGVTENRIYRWIRDGDLPLVDAFWLLHPQEQKKLKTIRGFFQMRGPPTVEALRRMVAILQTACGVKFRGLLVRKHSGLSTVKSSMSTRMKPGQVLTTKSVPLLLARLIAQLRLSQIVADYALALMGLPIFENNGSEPSTLHKKLPPPLFSCRVDKMVDISRLLAVIILACKYIPNWLDHLSGNYKPGQVNADQQIPISEQQIVSWSSEELRDLKNSQLPSYVDFLKEHLLTVEEAPFFPKEQEGEEDAETEDYQGPTVLPPEKVAAQGRKVASGLGHSERDLDLLVKTMETETGVSGEKIRSELNSIEREVVMREEKRIGMESKPLSKA